MIINGFDTNITSINPEMNNDWWFGENSLWGNLTGQKQTRINEETQNNIEEQQARLDEITDPAQYNELYSQLEATKDAYKKELIKQGLIDPTTGLIKDPSNITSFMKEQGIVDNNGKLITPKGLNQFYKDQGLLDNTGKLKSFSAFGTQGQKQGFLDANNKYINQKGISDYYKGQGLLDTQGKMRTPGDYNQQYGVTDANGNLVQAKDVANQYVNKDFMNYLAQRNQQNLSGVKSTVQQTARQQQLQGQGTRNLANEAMLTENAQRNITDQTTPQVTAEYQRAREEAMNELNKKMGFAQQARTNEASDIGMKASYAGTQAAEEQQNRANQIQIAGKLSDEDWANYNNQIQYANNLTGEERSNWLNKLDYATAQNAEAMQNYLTKLDVAGKLSDEQRNQIIQLLNTKLSINAQRAGISASLLQQYQTQLANAPDSMLNQLVKSLGSIGSQVAAAYITQGASIPADAASHAGSANE